MIPTLLTVSQKALGTGFSEASGTSGQELARVEITATAAANQYLQTVYLPPTTKSSCIRPPKMVLRLLPIEI